MRVPSAAGRDGRAPPFGEAVAGLDEAGIVRTSD